MSDERMDFLRQLAIAGDRLRALQGSRKSKALRGGVFEFGAYYLHSAVWRGPDKFHQVYFTVTDPASLLCLGFGFDKHEAKASAARVLRLFAPVEIATFLHELTADRRAEQEAYIEDQKRWNAKRERDRLKPPRVPRRRLAVFNKSTGKCHYCQTELDLMGKWHIEHMMPRALLGSNDEENLVAACVPCNMKKRDKTDLEFIASQGAA